MKQKEQETDWLMSAMMFHKAKGRWTFEDLAKATGYSAGTLNNRFNEMNPWQWSADMRNKVCKALGISQKKVAQCYALTFAE